METPPSSHTTHIVYMHTHVYIMLVRSGPLASDNTQQVEPSLTLLPPPPEPCDPALLSAQLSRRSMLAPWVVFPPLTGRTAAKKVCLKTQLCTNINRNRKKRRLPLDHASSFKQARVAGSHQLFFSLTPLCPIQSPPDISLICGLHR